MSKRANKVVFGWDSNNGFVAGEVNSGITAYAYPTSEHAKRAMNDPECVAAEMLNEESQVIPLPGIRDEYDHANWELLGRRPRNNHRNECDIRALARVSYLDAMAV